VPNTPTLIIDKESGDIITSYEYPVNQFVEKFYSGFIGKGFIRGYYDSK